MPTQPVSQRYYPALSELITVDDLPDFLAFAGAGLETLLNRIHYKNFQFSKSARGDSAFYSLEVVTNNLGLDLPFGLKLVLNPSEDDVSISSFPMSVQYQWELLAFLRGFNLQNFAFTPEAFFELGLQIFKMTDAQVIAHTLNYFVDSEDGTDAKFVEVVDTINDLYPTANLQLPVDEEPTVEMIAQLIADNPNIPDSVSKVMFLSYVLDTDLSITKRNLEQFYALMVPDGIENYIKNLIKPKLRTTLTLSAGIQFPPNILRPINLAGEPIAYEYSLFKFGEAIFYADTEAGIGNSVSFAGSLLPAEHMHEIGRTGLTISITNAKLDLSTNILNAGLNYTWHREDEQYFFINIMPAFTGEDAFKLLSDEHVIDFNLDYVKPLRQGRVELGTKIRRRFIPTDMQFFPGLNSPLDVNAGGWADYKETIPAVYANYVFENKNIEIEAGLRYEYVKVQYDVNPNHNTYKSDGYDYFQPFPNLRFGYKIDEHNKLSAFFNRRVDRPNEVDIRIFPKYDEPELLKVGNPTLRPQFTNTMELGYRLQWNKGSFYTSLYHKMIDATITRIATAVPGSTILYNIFQNAGKSFNTGAEMVLQQDLATWYSFNTSFAIYKNKIDAFTITNQYPVPTTYSMAEESITSGNVKLNNLFKLKGQTQIQLSGVYLAKDIIPQGTIGARFSVDLGIKKQIQQGKGELFLNGNDNFNTSRADRRIRGNGFVINSSDYLETQVFRLGYSYKF